MKFSLNLVAALLLLASAAQAAGNPAYPSVESLPGYNAAQTSEYLVKRGDTLSEILYDKFPQFRGMEVWDLLIAHSMDLNPQVFRQRSRHEISPGDVIALPSFGLIGEYQEPELPAPAAPAEPLPPVIATVQLGTPVVFFPSRESRKMLPGDPLREGDLVVAGSSAVELRLIDGSVLSLRPDSEVVLNELSFRQDQPGVGRMLVSVLKGGLRMVSGIFSKNADSEVLLRTPRSQIGIRGTDFAVRACEPGDCKELGLDVPNGDYVGLLQGDLGLSNEAVDGLGVNPGDVYLVARKDAVPELRSDLAGLLYPAHLWVFEPERECRRRFNRRNYNSGCAGGDGD